MDAIGSWQEGISLVVPLLNEGESLERLLDSVRGQTIAPEEIILVDGGSTDGTVALARKLTEGFCQFQIIEAGYATPGRGRNVGIAAAGRKWIALTDAGIRLEPTWLERLRLQTIRDPVLDVVYGNYEPVLSTRFERAAALSYVPAKQPRLGGRMRGPFIASSLLRKSVWQELGGFPDLRAAEDLIFMEQVQGSGFRIGWAPDATVWWQLQPSFSRTFRKFVLYSKHNVWAGRQRYWHYGIARQYLLALPFVALAIISSSWWLAVPAGGFVARIAKSIWIRREGCGVTWLLNPIQFVLVGLILGTIDMATFLGWIQACCTSPARSPSPLMTPKEVEARVPPRP